MKTEHVAQQLAIAGASIDAVEISVAAETRRARDSAVLRAVECVTVDSAKTQEAAAVALKKCKDLINEMEEARTTAGAPFLVATKSINQVAKDYSARLELEAKRLGSLVGNYQEAERMKAERVRLDLQRKEEAARVQLQMEEAARIKQETQGRTGTLTADLDAIRERAIDSIVEIKTQAAAAVVSAPSGLGLRKVWRFEVIDLGILAAHSPHLVTVSANEPMIRVAIKTNQTIPGLRIWYENSVSVRSGPSSAAAIDITPAPAPRVDCGY